MRYIIAPLTRRAKLSLGVHCFYIWLAVSASVKYSHKFTQLLPHFSYIFFLSQPSTTFVSINMIILTPTFLFISLSSASAVTFLSTHDSACSQTHIFLAEENNEPYPGRQGVLVNAICSGLNRCDYEYILFYNPAESSYCDSVTEGTANGIAQITASNQRCPDAKLVVSGCSQGVHIVGDILGGGGSTFLNGCQQKYNAALNINSAAGKKSEFSLAGRRMYLSLHSRRSARLWKYPTHGIPILQCANRRQ